jgi:hypothetical protein
VTGTARFEVSLTCHPTATTAAVNGIEVRVVRAADSGLRLCYLLTGDASRILVPAPRPPRRADDLWRHTCFEAFLRTPDGPEYWEVNLSPSGEWALWRFDDSRVGLSVPPVERPPDIEVRRAENEVALVADLDLSVIGRAGCSGALSVGLSAVVEEVGGRCSYWALAHPLDRPDFHHPDGFTLTLP